MRDSLTTEIRIVILSLFIGILLVIVDVVIEYFISLDRDFWGLLVLDASSHELITRVTIMVLSMLSGIIISGYYRSRLNALSALSVAEAKFASVIHNTADAVIVIDINGYISFMNHRAGEISGWNGDDALHRPISDVFYIINDDTGKKIDNPAEKILKRGKAAGLADGTMLIKKDGTKIPIEGGAMPTFDHRGKLNGAILVFRDESEKAGTEHETQKGERKFRSLIQTASIVILELSTDYKILEFNPEAERIFGLKRDEVIGKDYLNLFVLENERNGVAEDIKKMISGEPTTGYENRILTRDGQERIFLWNVNRIPGSDADPAGIIAIGYDITDRKRAEDAIRESEEKFRNVVESSPMGMHFYKLEPDGNLIFEGANRAADKLLGLDNKQFVGKKIEEAFPGSRGTEIADRYAAAASNGATWQTEQVNYVDQQIRGAFQVVAFQTTKNRMAAMFFDITEQKIIEKELKESEERFRNTFEQAAVGIAHVAPDGRLIRINQRFCDIVGHPREELPKHTFQDITHPDEVKRDVGFLRRLLSGDLKTYSIEKRYCRKDGSTAWAHLTTTLLRDPDNRPKYFISVIEDISDRKKAEEALKRTKFSVDRSVDAVYWMGPDARFIDVNEAACKALGYSREELLNMTVHDIDPNFPIDVWPSHWQELKRKGSFITESNHKTRDGFIFPVEIAINYLEIDGQEYNCAFARDITRRKSAEEALKESEEKFRNVAEQSPNMIFINKRGRIVYVNNRCEEKLGYAKEEFYSPDFDFFRLISPEYVQMIREKYDKHLAGEDIEPYEYSLLAKDGRIIDGIINTKLIHYEGENSLLGIVTDITDRKLAEEAIKESEEKFRTVAEQSPNMIFINRRGRIVYANRKSAEIMGYTKEEFYSPDFDFLGLIAPGYIQLIKENFARHINGQEVQPYEYALVTKDRKQIDAIINTKLIKYEGEISILGIVTDITDRKRAEIEFRKSQLNLLKAQQMAKVGSWEWDVAAGKVLWSNEMYRIFGFENGAELAVDLILKSIYPQDALIIEKAIEDVYNKIPPKLIEYRIIKPEGDIAYMQSTSEAQYDDRGNPVRIIGTVQDITERKRAEELREKLIADLQKAAREIKTLSGFIPICASCKKIRDDKGYWEQLEIYIMEHSDAEFSHGLCPECSKKLYPDL